MRLFQTNREKNLVWKRFKSKQNYLNLARLIRLKQGPTKRKCRNGLAQVKRNILSLGPSRPGPMGSPYPDRVLAQARLLQAWCLSGWDLRETRLPVSHHSHHRCHRIHNLVTMWCGRGRTYRCRCNATVTSCDVTEFVMVTIWCHSYVNAMSLCYMGMLWHSYVALALDIILLNFFGTLSWKGCASLIYKLILIAIYCHYYEL